MATSNEPVFSQLVDFAITRHRESSAAASSAEFTLKSTRAQNAAAPGIRAVTGVGKRPVPAALVFAGGVNPSDHAQTFPALLELLRETVCPTLPHSLSPVPEQLVCVSSLALSLAHTQRGVKRLVGTPHVDRRGLMGSDLIPGFYQVLEQQREYVGIEIQGFFKCRNLASHVPVPCICYSSKLTNKGMRAQLQ